MRLRPALGTVLLCLVCIPTKIRAQESAGQAEIGFQQYYLTSGQQRIANIAGLTLHFAEFLPNVGLLSGSLSPAVSSNQFRTGDDYLQIKELPWQGQHWTFTAGDFRLPGQLLPVSFTNLYFPEITARGGAVQASHGNRTIGFFWGEATLSNTPRVVLRLQVPQTLMGAYYRQKFGKRLEAGVRFMHFATNLAALQKSPILAEQTHFKESTSLNLDALFTVARPLKLYFESTWSTGQQDLPAHNTRDVPVSTLVGPLFDTKRFSFRANYTIQNSSYFPLLGYYLGDRQGAYGEVKFRPFGRVELYMSASTYENNVGKNPTLPTFQNVSESVGLSLLLPAKISLNAQMTILDLSTRSNTGNPWLASKDRQELLLLSRQFGRHNIRVAGRDFEDNSRIGAQRQRSIEVDDTFRIRKLYLGAGARFQRATGTDSRTTVFYRGLAQYSGRHFSAYANFETGNDLQNRTLFATNTVSTTVFGASFTTDKGWNFQLEAYRNQLLTELNPASIFVLQGQGVVIPGTLAALNQWSVYFRAVRSLSWGKAGIGEIAQYARTQTPLKGSVEGFVIERLPEGNRPAEGVSVSLDGRFAVTDAEGRYRFGEVPEGPHQVALAIHELPAEFDPGKATESTVVVQPNNAARTDFDVVRLGQIDGKVTGPKGVPVESVIIRLTPGQHYTTPDSEGEFHFYNIREGRYEVELDKTTLPEFGVLAIPERVPLSIQPGGQPEPVNFVFDVKVPAKQVRKVLEKK